MLLLLSLQFIQNLLNLSTFKQLLSSFRYFPEQNEEKNQPPLKILSDFARLSSYKCHFNTLMLPSNSSLYMLLTCAPQVEGPSMPAFPSACFLLCVSLHICLQRCGSTERHCSCSCGTQLLVMHEDKQLWASSHKMEHVQSKCLLLGTALPGSPCPGWVVCAWRLFQHMFWANWEFFLPLRRAAKD